MEEDLDHIYHLQGAGAFGSNAQDIGSTGGRFGSQLPPVGAGAFGSYAQDIGSNGGRFGLQPGAA